ncbi:ATP-binding protein [Zavarzinia compransoris]|uniref:Chromosome segregation protein SMC n=1 Tax=Zavarzinia compransoris TaxID=1264899 RepID=A0A317DUT1_9PROT|nr:YhaN family protein [Zavarzinia compransoris]PWR17606.1 chromosome segregation protein SMC [Zavarzinia compransoris]TDP44100.1 AAA domain-containing protein [Zavarzinia compransoris]
MRLNRLDLIRYGKFTDASLAFHRPAPGSPDLHLIYGPNEAGKSTALSAWLDLLFGIPQRTRHDFLHDGPTMRIGASIEIDGHSLELARVKKQSGSLQDAHGGLLPEAVLQSGLGGIGRDAYEAMFSLDDDTLERGGDSILASKGDLGEMLFAASAGLTGLSGKLDALREQASSFHRPGGRKGPITDAKARLAELDARRKVVDTQAAAYGRLLSDLQEAEDAWRQASATHDDYSRELARVGRLLAILPLRTRLQRLQEELAPLATVADAPASWDAELNRLLEGQTVARTREEGLTTTIARFTEALDALAPDPAILAAEERIAAADLLRSAYDEAVRDLPNRELQATEEEHKIRALLETLCRPGSDPRGLLLDAATIEKFRDLIARRSGIEAQLNATQTEARKATLVVKQCEARLAGTVPIGDTAVLASLLFRIKQRDPGDALRRAERDMQAAEGTLTEKMAALVPWAGTPEELERMPVPAGWQIEGWVSRAETARSDRVDARRQEQALREAVEHQAVMLAETPRSTAISLDDAATARAAREKLWAVHRRDLGAETADAFEVALRRDDQVLALIAEAQAEAKVDAVARANLAAQRQELATAEATLARAEATAAAIDHEIRAATDVLGLPGHTLPELRGWLEARLGAMAALSAWRQATRGRDVALRDIDEDSTTLRQALAAPETPLHELSFDRLVAEAQARIDQSTLVANLREALREAREAADERNEALAEAHKIDTGWQAAWTECYAPTWLASTGADAAAMTGILACIDKLAITVANFDSLTHRVTAMRENRDAFLGALSAIATELGSGGDAPSWRDISGRLRQAEKIRDERAKADTELEAARRDLAVVADEIENLDRRLAAMAGHFGLDDTAVLAKALADSRKAASLRHEIAACEKDIAEASSDGETTEAIEAAEAGGREELEIRKVKLGLEVGQLQQDLQQRYATVSALRSQIEAVGGDDKVATIEAERSNLLLSLEEDARQHLALRLGILLVDKGLHRYRDQHRSGMLERASQAFSTLSRGAYARLAAQPDGTREVLVAVTESHGAKMAQELSKGTRFQLYLALRIAGYHELARSRPPVPFIADDIMETFDDDRSAEAFTLLGEMARTGQVIYLTHHRHLCDIARKICPEAQIHVLDA